MPLLVLLLVLTLMLDFDAGLVQSCWAAAEVMLDELACGTETLKSRKVVGEVLLVLDVAASKKLAMNASSRIGRGE